MSELAGYIEPTEFIDSESGVVKDIVNKIYLRSRSRIEFIIKLFYYVRDEVRYELFIDYFNRGSYKASNTLSRRYGYCVQKAIALAALYRASFIPARVCFADIINHNLPSQIYELFKTNQFVYHGYVEAYINGRWVKLTPAFDKEASSKMNIDPLEFDGYNDVVLPKYNRDGKIQFTYVKYRGCYREFPYEDLVREFLRVYPVK
jgi:transglutaminase-like putative cysteine protease